MEIEKILNRKPYTYLLDNNNFIDLKDKNILITGASGSIGLRLQERLKEIGCNYIATDKDTLDVTKILETAVFINKNNFDYIVNLAGAKHAPNGEIDVEETLNINTHGVINLLNALPKTKIILASTCKSCNPETVYGATKLISERLIMNSGGSVARFYNVVESSGNVFEIWKDKEVIDVVDKCNRYFISLDEAVGLIMYAALNKGRYSVNINEIQNMGDIANKLYPDINKNIMNPRKGDRINELKIGSNESFEIINDAIIKVNNYFDANI